MRHDESRRGKERTPEAVKVLSDCSNAEDTSTSGRGHTRSEHRWEEMIGETKEGTGAAKDAIISDALALERIVSESELCVNVISAVPLDVVMKAVDLVVRAGRAVWRWMWLWLLRVKPRLERLLPLLMRFQKLKVLAGRSCKCKGL